jgi:hypothetical protein
MRWLVEAVRIDRDFARTVTSEGRQRRWRDVGARTFCLQELGQEHPAGER